MTKKLIIIGSGENSFVTENILNKKYEITGFLDDFDTSKRVIGKFSDYPKFIKKNLFFISIGNNSKRKEVFLKMASDGCIFVNAIHPSAKLEENIKFGRNIFIGALAYVNVGSSIGDGTFINNGCIIEHDNKIGHFCHLAPGVVTGGRTTIGNETFIGLGSRINDHLTIGNQSIIGSGSVVIDSIPDRVTAVGIPSRIVKK